MNELQQNLALVLKRIQQQVIEDEDDAEMWAVKLEKTLDSLHEDDFFGTEGQCDPRGDFRDGDWSIFSEVQSRDD